MSPDVTVAAWRGLSWSNPELIMTWSGAVALCCKGENHHGRWWKKIQYKNHGEKKHGEKAVSSAAVCYCDHIGESYWCDHLTHAGAYG